MNVPVASVLVNVPDAGAAALAATGGDAAPDAMFGALLSALTQMPEGSAPATEGAAAPQPNAAPALQPAPDVAPQPIPTPMSVTPSPWMAQLDAQSLAPPAPEQNKTARQAAPDSASEPDAAAKTATAEPAASPELPAPSALPTPNLPAPKTPVAADAVPPDVEQTLQSGSGTPRPSTPDANAPPPQAANAGVTAADEERPAIATDIAAGDTDENSANATNAGTADEPAVADSQDSTPARQTPVKQADRSKDEKRPVQGAGDANPSPAPVFAVLVTNSAPPIQLHVKAVPGAEPDHKGPAAAPISATGETSAAPANTSAPAQQQAASSPSLDAPKAQHQDSTRGSPKDLDPASQHGPKSEPGQAASAAPQEAAPTPASANHGPPDLAVAPSLNAQRSASTNADTPVKLSFTPPGIAETPSFDALALKIAARSADGDSNFSIRLDPPELGRVEVNLNVNSQGHAQAELSADKPQTLELLQKDAPALERALKDAGLNLSGGLAFSLKGDGKSGAWRDSQGNARGRNVQIAAADAASANATLAESAARAAHAYGLPAARLDIRI